MEVLPGIAIKCFLLVAVFFLPGWWYLRPYTSYFYSLEFLAFSAVFSSILTGSLFYLTTMILGQVIPGIEFTEWYVLAAALVIMAGISVFRLKPRTIPPPKLHPTMTRRAEAAILAGALLVGSAYTLTYEGGPRQTFAECIYTGTLMNLVNIEKDEAREAFVPAGSSMPIKAQSEKIHGLTTGNGQREGSIIFQLPFIPCFQIFGFHMAFLSIHVWIFLLGVFFVLRRIPHVPTAWIAALFLALHPIILVRTIPDENVMTLASLLAIFTFISIIPINKYGLGVLAGFAMTLMHEIALPIGVFLVAKGYRGEISWRRLRPLFIGMAWVVFPMFLHHHFSMGGVFNHESLTQFGPIKHSFLGYEFDWHGLLNWPFYPQMVRTPFTAFPPFLLFPLYFIKHSGYLFASLTVAGLVLLWVQSRAAILPLVAFGLTVYASLSVQANWMEPKKMGTVLFMFPPLLLGFAFALRLFFQKSLYLRLAVTWLAVFGVMYGGERWLGTVQFPPDPRTELFLPELHAMANYQDILKNYDKWVVLANVEETEITRRHELRGITCRSWAPRLRNLRELFMPIALMKNAIFSVRDFVYSDFGYYEDNENDAAMDYINNAGLPNNAFRILRNRHPKKMGAFGEWLRTLPWFTVQDRVYLTLDMGNSWVVKPPLLEGDFSASNRILRLHRGQFHFIYPCSKAPNGYYRVACLSVDSYLNITMFGFFVAQEGLDHLLRKQTPFDYTMDEEWLNLDVPAPATITIEEGHRMFPGKSYGWFGEIGPEGKLRLSHCLEKNN